MDRNQGLRRTTAITGVLVAASLAGTLAVGIAAHAAESTTADSSPATAENSGDSSPATAGTEGSTATEDAPSLSTGSDGQATSGGS